MDQPKRAVLIMEEDALVPAHSKPLMLEAVLFCPILTWMGNRLRADGVQRFFVVCGPRFAEEAKACFPAEADVTVSERQEDLNAFLNTPDTVSVLLRPALPMEEAGPGFAYAVPGYELQEAWKNGLTNRVEAAELLDRWVPVFSLETVAELELVLRDRIVKRHIQNGVRVMDPSAVYIDPRVSIGRGTMVLPGSILRGETAVGRDCVIGPNAMVRDCTVGDETEINASQANESVIGSRTHVGPFAYIRPGCAIGDDIKVGDFVEVKNSTIGDGTKISHLTYVGDSDVGKKVNFGCGTVTTNYDGFKKYRCTIGDGAFLGCNTNLVAPVTVGGGSYTAAGSTVTEEVPPDALAVARSRQKNIEGWAARRRKLHGKDR
ncbi:glucosamine-1-phosphate N-acetyltransferase [uncultured Oscillibacter sp.]|uniref:glucosamine-1-phosphate N-acetyltransferase n=1 Tax=uncultured Oscillibacter sp. TaxID=876091 RepID=UPI0025F09301|nr:glucosamine-1-phosphate N-acetyltransferase [uncultured Oscillibacter sp.]